ncbi:hypothetical protein CRG98_013543 [Punica granatum]|uniref:Uncharacterized protein n=1 Tax=Punica granatum TaxID=22663 RepID=A0A2I0KBZ2_PUNGR|nr:hypothetical protein CRG98_013543 [Punica granatum]
MPSLIAIPPRSVAALSPRDIQHSMAKQVAKVVQTAERKQLGLPPIEEDSKSHLCKEILHIEVPYKFTPPQIVLYDWNTDPVNHVRHPTASLLERGVSKQVQYLLFPITLT